MTTKTDDFKLADFEAIISGKLPAARAGRGKSSEVKIVFTLAEKLGQLRRGETVQFTRNQASELYTIIENAAPIIMMYERAETPFAKAVCRILNLSLTTTDSFSWASKLNPIRRGVAGLVSTPEYVRQ